MAATDDRTAVTFSLSPGHAHDAPHGRALIETIIQGCPASTVIMDRAYVGDVTSAAGTGSGLYKVVPSKSNRIEPWEYDKEMYKNAMSWNGCFAA